MSVFSSKTPVVFHGAKLQSSFQGLGFLLSFLCSTAQHSRVALTAQRIGQEDVLICLFSGSVKPEMMLRKSLSCPLKVTQEANQNQKMACLLLIRTQQYEERQQHLNSMRRLLTKYKARVGLLGWVNTECHSAQRVSPFLVWTKERFHAFPGSCGSPRRLSHVTCNETKSELLSYSLISITLKFTNTFSSTSLHQLLFCQNQMITGSIITPQLQTLGTTTVLRMNPGRQHYFSEKSGSFQKAGCSTE